MYEIKNTPHTNVKTEFIKTVDQKIDLESPILIVATNKQEVEEYISALQRKKERNIEVETPQSIERYLKKWYPKKFGTVIIPDLDMLKERVKFTREVYYAISDGGKFLLISQFYFPGGSAQQWNETLSSFVSLLRDFSTREIFVCGDVPILPEVVCGIAIKGDEKLSGRVEKELGSISPPFYLAYLKEKGKDGDNGVFECTLSPYYLNTRPEVHHILKENLGQRVLNRTLEVGCAAGLFSFELKKKGVAQMVFGVETDYQVSKIASLYLDDVIHGDIEELELPFPQGYFDGMFFLDVLEHLIDPWATLKKMKKYLKDDALVVMSIPNIRHHSIINNLVLGRWEYEDEGILDRTHLRFFTLSGMIKMIAEAGLKVKDIRRIFTQEFNRIKNLIAPGKKQNIDIGTCVLKNQSKEDIEDLFTYQYIIVAENQS